MRWPQCYSRNLREAIMLEDVRATAEEMLVGRGHVHAVFSADDRDHVPWITDGATVTCGLNQPYLIEIDLQTERADADPGTLLGVASQLRIVRANRLNTYAGIVSSVRILAPLHAGPRAKVTLEPALAALRHGRCTRIFQDLTVPEVIEQVLRVELGAYGRTLRSELRRSYPKREYTVQYQESHFDFVHRLMEEEGIIYYFTHDDAAETLVLIDSPAQYPRVNDLYQYSNIGDTNAALEEERVTMFEPVARIGGTEVATRHFDWTHPSVLINGHANG